MLRISSFVSLHVQGRERLGGKRKDESVLCVCGTEVWIFRHCCEIPLLPFTVWVKDIHTQVIAILEAVLHNHFNARQLI